MLCYVMLCMLMLCKILCLLLTENFCLKNLLDHDSTVGFPAAGSVSRLLRVSKKKLTDALLSPLAALLAAYFERGGPYFLKYCGAVSSLEAILAF